MNEWVQKSVANWKLSKVQLNPPATINEIEKVESILNFKFPDDFKQLFLVIDGFRSFCMEEHMFTFWPLETIVQEYTDWGNNEFVGFCDYLIASHSIGYKRNEKGIYKRYQMVDYEETILIAETLEELLSMINSDSQLIY